MGSKFSRIRFVTDPDKALAFCHVPKAASSSWMQVFAGLNQLQKREDLIKEYLSEEELLSGQLPVTSTTH